MGIQWMRNQLMRWAKCKYSFIFFFVALPPTPPVFMFARLFSFWFHEMKITSYRITPCETKKKATNERTNKTKKKQRKNVFLISTHRHIFRFILYLYSFVFFSISLCSCWQKSSHTSLNARIGYSGSPELFPPFFGFIWNFLPITDFL